MSAQEWQSRSRGQNAIDDPGVQTVHVSISAHSGPTKGRQQKVFRGPWACLQNMLVRMQQDTQYNRLEMRDGWVSSAKGIRECSGDSRPVVFVPWLLESKHSCIHLFSRFVDVLDWMIE